MSARIRAIGTATPRESVSQADLAAAAGALVRYTPEQRRLMERFYERSSIRRRAGVVFAPGNGHGPEIELFQASSHDADRGPTTASRLARYARSASGLAIEAAAGALAGAGVETDRVRHLVTATCTGFEAPGVDVELIGALGLDASVTRTCIGFMGCHGALNALRVADALVRAEPDAAAIVCAVELCSLHFFYGWDPEKVLANALFADGAGAMVVDARPGPAPWQLRQSASHLLDDSREAMTWRIGDHGFEMTLSRDVPRLIRRHLRPWMSSWLADHALAIGDVGSWAIHPGGPRILDAVADALSLDDDATSASRDVLAAHGNMSSPTILFILERLRERAAAGPCVALGFGPGLAIEAALLEPGEV